MRRSPIKRKPRKAGAMPPGVREEVLNRDRWRCQAPYLGFQVNVRCSQGLHVHHALLRSHGGENIPEHLLTLCPLHHLWAHERDRAGAEAAGVIRRGEHSSEPPVGG
jgi:hypothetical protein